MPVEARKRHLVEVDEPEPPDAGPKERGRGVRADATEPDDDDERVGKQGLAAGAEELPIARELLPDDLVSLEGGDERGGGLGAGEACRRRSGSRFCCCFCRRRRRRAPSRCLLFTIVAIVAIAFVIFSFGIGRCCSGYGGGDPEAERDFFHDLSFSVG